jgi:hypothetical protein
MTAIGSLLARLPLRKAIVALQSSGIRGSSEHSPPLALYARATLDPADNLLADTINVDLRLRLLSSYRHRRRRFHAPFGRGRFRTPKDCRHRIDDPLGRVSNRDTPG